MPSRVSLCEGVAGDHVEQVVLSESYTTGALLLSVHKPTRSILAEPAWNTLQVSLRSIVAACV